MHGKTMTDRRNLPFHLVCCLLLFVTGLSAQSLQIIDAEGHSTVLTAIQIGDSSEGDQRFFVKAISSFAIPIRSRSAATLVLGLCRK
jgi:hypothetical protein